MLLAEALPNYLGGLRGRILMHKDENTAAPASAGKPCAHHAGCARGRCDERLQFGRAHSVVVSDAGMGLLEVLANCVDIAVLQ